MGNFTEMLIFLTTTISSLYIAVVLLRFLLQLVHADFYNPMSQFIVKATNPLLIPLRRVIPGIFGIDIASIVLALLLQTLAIEAIYVMQYGQFPSFIAVLITSAFKLIAATLDIYFWALIIMVILSWVSPYRGNPVTSLISSLLYPLLHRIQQLIPPIGGLDFSPMVAMIIIYCLKVLFGVDSY